MSSEDIASRYRSSERRLKDLLLGDATFTVGLVKGEEQRRRVARELRLLREAFDAALAAADAGRAERAEARVADLEEELRRIAAEASRPAAKRRSRSRPDEKA